MSPDDRSPAPPEPAVPAEGWPDAFGPYRVVRPLSSGGMGLVWEARAGDAEVAIKTARAADEAMLRGIRAEVRALERIRHPGVVRILGHGDHQGLPWYAMELLRGTTLRCVLRDLFPARKGAESTFPTDLGERPRSAPPTPPAEVVVAAMGQLPRVLDVFRALAEVLEWIHGEGVVHRDLKPENVFVRPSGAPVLVDFGMSHAVVGAGASRESLDALALGGGTLDYMAPEQALGDVVDARADLYALGVMLFEALCGRPPFEGSRATVLFAKIGQRAPSVEVMAAGVPRPLVRLVEDLLHPDPARRTAHARVVVAVLASLGAAPGPQAPGEPRPYVYRPAFQPPGDVARTLIDGALLVGPLTGRHLHVRGAAGAGKTRVVVEVVQTLRQQGFDTVSCPCVPAPGSRASPPLDPLRPLLRGLVDRALAAGDDGTDGLLATHGPLLARFEPALRELPSVRGAGDAPELRPDTERARLYEAVAAALRRYSGDGRVVLVVDDLQFADELTRAVLEALRPEDLANVALITAGTGAGAPSAQELALPPLRDDQVRAMLAAMCGATDAPQVLVEAVAARAAGNPFVVAELLREAVRVGLLDRDATGAWGLRAPDLAALQVPGTVEALVDHRLAAVPSWAEPALRWAAVVGNGSEEWLLARRADPEAVDALVRAEVLGFDDRGRVRFASPTLAEVVHERMAGAERRALHAAAALALQPARPGRHGRIARHLREAQDPTAGAASLVAGEEALGGLAFEAALRELRAATELLPADAPADLRVRLQLRIGRAWWGAGDPTRSHAALEQALVSASEPRPGRGVWSGLRLAWELAREVARAFLPDRVTEPEAAVAERHAQLAEAHRLLLYLDILRNEPLGSVASALRAAAHGSAGGRRARRATDLATLGVMAGFAGVGALSARWFARAEERLRRSRDRQDEVTVSLARASLALGRGRWTDLFREIDRGDEAALAVGDAEQHAVLGQLRGTALQLSGRVEQAAQQCDVVIATSRAQLPRTWARCVLVDTLLSLGRTDRAASELRTVLVELGAGGDHATRSNALALQALLAWDQGLPAEARAAATAATTLCRAGSEDAFATYPYHCHAPWVWLRLAAASPGDEALLAEARRAVEGAARYAARFAIGRPPALRHEGVLRALDGDGVRAAAALERARDAALALGMAEQAALARAESVRTEPADRRELVAREAAADLRALGCLGALRRSPAGGVP